MTPSGAAAAKAKKQSYFCLKPKILTTPMNTHFAKKNKLLTLSGAYLETGETVSVLALANPSLVFSLLSAA